MLLEHFRIDDTHSNAYTVWKAMGSPQHPTPEQYAAAAGRRAARTAHLARWLDVKNGEVVLTTEMPRQAISLLHLKW